LFEVFYDLLSEDGDDDLRNVPLQFHRLVKDTFDLKNDIEFGYAVTRSEMSHNELLGSRAYQRASNRLTAEENERIRLERRNQNG
jgi:hypothetical protein